MPTCCLSFLPQIIEEKEERVHGVLESSKVLLTTRPLPQPCSPSPAFVSFLAKPVPEKPLKQSLILGNKCPLATQHLPPSWIPTPWGQSTKEMPGLRLWRGEELGNNRTHL